MASVIFLALACSVSGLRDGEPSIPFFQFPGNSASLVGSHSLLAVCPYTAVETIVANR